MNEKDVETKQHLALLWDFIETELRTLLQKIKDYRRHGICDYSTIWTVFEPKSLIFAHRYGREQLYRCVHGFKDDGVYNLEAQYVDWDGEKFGLASANISIHAFHGTKSLSSLPAIPIAYYQRRAEIEQRTLARGRVFESLQGYHYKMYCGVAVEATGQKSASFDVKSRIKVDTAGKIKISHSFKHDLNSFRIQSFQSKRSSQSHPDRKWDQ